MKKIVEKLKSKKELFIGIIIGGIVASFVGVVSTIATNSIASNYVLYDSPSGKKNVKDAIDELYTMSSTRCPEGYICSKIPIGTGPTVVPSITSDTHLGIVYLDPTDLTKNCDASNSVSATGTKTGYMKWYIYNMVGTTYDLILDHSTTASVSGYIADSQLITDTSNWVSGLNPRLITADEVWNITKSTAVSTTSSWSQATATKNDYFWFENNVSGQGTSKYAWLYDYTSNCTSWGCNTAADRITNGYWTQSKVAGSSSSGWFVEYEGMLKNKILSNTDYGVRPVITISKS